MLEAGARVRDYEVWGRLGGGGMSDVWLARHAVLATPVIIKTLKPDVCSDPAERLSRMVSEARLMARVVSPHVVQAVDAGMHEETPYLVQEYVDGVDLNELDHARRRALGVGLPLWFVCDAIAQIAHGLHVAHQNGVLHRDVKPSNLFGAPEVGVKLGDFGVAVNKQLGEQALAGSSGTLKFMSPEALRGEALDRASDVFSLGATAFDLRYGRGPFPDLRTLLDGEPHPAFPPPMGPEEAYFQHVLARMLAPAHHARYPDLLKPRRLLEALSQSLKRPRTAQSTDDGDLRLGELTVSFTAGDIARAHADGIVCSANYELKMRSGVGEALRRAGGQEIETEAMRGGQQPLGACVATNGGRLDCQRVLHAVSAWQEASCVGRATQRVLLMAEELGLSSLAVPALGTGAARITLEACASAVASALRWHMALGGSRLKRIDFVLFDERARRVFREVVEGQLFDEDGAALDEIGRADEPCSEQASVSADAPTLVMPLTRD